MSTKCIPELFGKLVFNDTIMKARLPHTTYKALRKTIEDGKPLDISIADPVANAMKDWAVENGCTHFTHWFQPMTGITAEKHDSFISPEANGKVVMEFSGKELVRGEPDASSFPSGGLRATFEARGYTAWDPTSCAFIKGNTLCIPTIFCSYTGEALDKKTPLLRSTEALNKQAMRILKLFGNEDVTSTKTTVGPEQEYFLVDRDMYNQREDMVLTGRTLFGAMPPRGQEMEDHYFGAIKPRVAAFMNDLNEELWKLGILAKTEHNEVAPSQHEMAPIFTDTNTATDHNQLTMEIMKKVAEKHNLYCLLHEKPFDGVNGSGKHNNWSMSTNTGVNLLEPGDSPMENAQFLLFLTAVIKAVDEYQDLLRISVATPGNDHRLGANEAPPAVVSMFLGDELTEILESIESGTPYNPKNKQSMEVGVTVLPHFPKDSTDRNRTSPFAFTGNRFEYRAVGSSANCASALIVLNTIVAEQLKCFKKEVDVMVDKGVKKDEAILQILKKYIKETKAIRFDGNGYSQEWVEEAARRGLLNISNVPEALKAYLTEKSIKVFAGSDVFSVKELEARVEVELEKFTKKIQIESRVLGDLSVNHIIPTGVSYMNTLITNVQGLKDVFGDGPDFRELVGDRLELIKKISNHIHSIKTKTTAMVNERKIANKEDDLHKKADLYNNNVRPYLEDVRYHIDKLELIVDNEIWPLPKYRELLFAR
ncbi:MAG TPA: glutamine synthetase type III [Marinilabiliaceae bacterium]|nr:glutamine synthetase type III [Marinilabiliaceae bacterium]